MIQFKIIFQVLKNSLLACLLKDNTLFPYLHIDLPNKHFFPSESEIQQDGVITFTLLRSLCQEQFLPRVLIQANVFPAHFISNYYTIKLFYDHLIFILKLSSIMAEP